MAMSGDRKRFLASSKFSRSTRETYSGSNPMPSSLAAKPTVEQPPLRLGRRRHHFELPALLRLGAERHRHADELFATRDEKHHSVARLVLFEPVLEPIGAHQIGRAHV